MELLPYSLDKSRLRNKNLYTSVVNNNEGIRRYFSSIDAEIYFGDIFIDDINSIHYEVVEKVLPVYGYNSFKYDYLMNGVRLVSGQFTINFTKSGWLVDIIKGLGTSATSAYGDVNGCAKRPDICDVVGTGYFDGIFDIIVSFGDHNSAIQSYNSSAHMIKGVRITSFSQSLDVSGEPIAETYTFIAQDIVFNIDGQGKLNNNFVAGNNDISIDHTNKDSKEKSVNVKLAYALNRNEITSAQELANNDTSLSLSLMCEHNYINNKGTITTSFNVMNDSVDSKDIVINKIAIKSTDKRSEFKNLPVFKSTDFKYTHDSHRDMMCVMPLEDLSLYNKQIYKAFKQLKDDIYIDAVITMELTYKGVPVVISNKPIKITPGESYNL